MLARTAGVALALALFTVGAARPARAQVTTLRIASPAPPGTAWAREGTAFSREVERLTHGTLKIKFYLGGITGDELETAQRIRRGQLDGIASGGMLCMRLAPSMRVLRVPGLLQTREESAYVSGRLRQVFDAELAKNGFTNLGEINVGPDVILSRTPIRTMAELKRARLWAWDLDSVFRLALPAMGLNIVPVPLAQAARAYDEQRIDGFVAVPTAALAFQWSAQARYVTDLRFSFLRGCMLISNRAFDELPIASQEALRSAFAKLVARLSDLERTQDEALLGGLFEKQGVKSVPASSAFRSEVFEAAQGVRERLGDRLVPHALLQRVLALLADFRAEHSGSSAVDKQ
jgi:TRAP-type C4-dicarboxylate transport system substrate-binding protein